MSLIDLAKRVLGAIPTVPLLTYQPKTPSFKVAMGKGPSGKDIIYVYGVRWPSYGDKPRVMVRAYSAMSGDTAIGFFGPRIKDWPLPIEAKRLVQYDGMSVETVEGIEKVLDPMGLAIPTKPEPDRAFHMRTYKEMAHG